MKKNILLCIVFMLLILTSCEKLEMTNEVIDTTSQLQLAPPVYDHIFVVWFENFDRDDIWGSSSCPYMNSLIRSGTLFKSFYCYTNSASQPNYVVAFAGSRCGINTNSTLSGRPLTNPNLHTALVAKGKTFKTYCEGIPYAGSTTSSSGYYRRRHNAPINFSNVPGSLIRPFPLPSNYDSYATVTWIVPNLRNDGHDTGKGYADNWMKNTLKPMVEKTSKI